MTEGTCIVGILASTNHPEVPRSEGVTLFRAYALGCKQEGPWRDTQTWAEVDAARMDAHACPERAREDFARLIPYDRLRTKRDALHTESTLRYMPHRQ